MNSNELFPIYELWHIPFWQTNGFYIGLGVVLFSVLVLAVWYGIKKYRSSKKNTKPSWTVALEELEDINQKLLSEGMIGKTFYFRLTWIFKRYLHTRYGFDVYGKTDKEIWMYLERVGLDQNWLHDLKSIFEGSSVIKFANQEAIIERMKRDLQMSEKLIKKPALSDDGKSAK